MKVQDGLYRVGVNLDVLAIVVVDHSRYLVARAPEDDLKTVCSAALGICVKNVFHIGVASLLDLRFFVGVPVAEVSY